MPSDIAYNFRGDGVLLGKSSENLNRSNFSPAGVPIISVIAFRSYTGPMTIGPGPSFETSRVSRCARGLSSVPLRQPLFQGVDDKARRGGGTTIHIRKTKGRHWPYPKVVVRSLRRSSDAPHYIRVGYEVSLALYHRSPEEGK